MNKLLFKSIVSILLSVSLTLIVSNLGAQSYYVVENQLAPEFCDSVDVTVVIWTCGTTCNYSGCYNTTSFKLGPGDTYNVTLNGGDWVGRLDAYGNCTWNGFETCSASSTTFQHEEYSSCNPPASGPGCQTVTIAGDTSTGAQIY